MNPKSPGAYKGTTITGGTDAQVAEQIARIDGAQKPVTPQIDPTMDASKLTTPTSGFNLAPKTETVTPDITNLASTQATQAIAPTPTAPVAPSAPQASPSLTDRLAGLFGQSQNKEQDLANQIAVESEPYAKQLNEYETQIKMHQANSLSRQEKALNSGETQGYATGEAQRIQRTDAIEALKLSALSEGMRGNIALAEKHATNAINAKYADINKQLSEARDNIYNNYDSLSPAEKKRADATLLRLDKDDAFVKKSIEDDKITQGFLQEAIATSQKNGQPIDTLTLKRAGEANSPTEALQILAPFMEDAEAKKVALLDREYKQSQINENNAQAGKIRSGIVGSGGSSGSGTSGSSGSFSSITQSIINNPSLFDDLTPTVRGKVLSELQANGYETSNLGVKGLSDTAVKEISQTDKALADLKELRTKMQDNTQFLGPLKGLQRLNPYSKSRRIQADVDRVRQTVGKALEGGVLRKEDEEKYKKILSTLSDTPGTAIYKIDALTSSIQRDIENYKKLQKASGRSNDVSESLGKRGAAQQKDLRAKYSY